MSGNKEKTVSTAKTASSQLAVKRHFVSAPAVEMQAGLLIPSFLQQPVEALGFKCVPYQGKPGFFTFEIASRIGADDLHKLLTSAHTTAAEPDQSGSDDGSSDSEPMDLDSSDEKPKAKKRKQMITDTQVMPDD